MPDPIIARHQRLWSNPSRRGVVYTGHGPNVTSERLKAFRWDWWVPSQGTGAGGTALFPLSLGCPPVLTSEGKEWIGKLIHGPEDVDRFQPPPVETGKCGEVLAQTRSARQADANVRIRQCDIQSPLGVAELMWDASFYTALIEQPAAVHKLLDKITDFEIAFILEQKRLAGERFIASGFPAIWSGSEGTFVADDTMSLISPMMHMEFSVPYLNRISEACGGLYYHTCTLRPNYYPNVRAIRGVRGFNCNPGNSCPTHDIIREFAGEFVFTFHLVVGMHATTDVLAWPRDASGALVGAERASPRPFRSEAEFLRYWLDSMTGRTAMSIYFSDICQVPEIIEPVYDLLDERGLSPRACGIR